MFRRLAQVGLSVGTGLVTQAVNQRLQERAGQTPGQGVEPPRPEGSFERGDTKLKRMADAIRPEAGSSAFTGAVDGFVESRQRAATSVGQVGAAVVRGEVGIDDVSQSVGRLKEQLAFSGKVVQAASHGELSVSDGARVAGAGVKHTGEKVLDAFTQGRPLDALKSLRHATKSGAEGLYASSTVSEEGLGSVRDAFQERAKYEAQKVATGVAISTGVSAVAGAIHPGLGVVARIASGMAMGHQIGEAANRIHGGSEKGEMGAMRAEIRKIVEEKASGPTAPFKKD